MGAVRVVKLAFPLPFHDLKERMDAHGSGSVLTSFSFPSIVEGRKRGTPLSLLLRVGREARTLGHLLGVDGGVADIAAARLHGGCSNGGIASGKRWGRIVFVPIATTDGN